MPRFQLHIVDAENNENIRQPIIEADDEVHARTIRLGEDEALAAVTEVNEQATTIEYPDGHPFEESWESQ